MTQIKVETMIKDEYRIKKHLDGEYEVEVIEVATGLKNPQRSYFTDDRQDAEETMATMKANDTPSIETQVLSISTREHFKAEYRKCKTFGDWDKLIARMSDQLKVEIYNALQVCIDTVGATMREESFIIALRHNLPDPE